MYKLLIVDDKSLVIEGLKNLLDWKSYGIQIVGEADDGQKGIALAQNLKPNIIITDIKMPGMNGLDMIKKIRDTDPTIHFIVISGYDDFELAKKAFQYGAIDYLIKPVDFDQLDNVLKRILEKLKTATKEENEKAKVNLALQKSRRVILKEALTDLLIGRYDTIDTVEAKLNLAEVKLGDESFAVMVVRVANGLKENPSSKDALKLAEEYLESIKFGYSVSINDETTAIVITAPGLNYQWLRILADFLYMKFFTGDSFTIGVGDIYWQLNRIKHSYIEAERAVQYHYLIKSPVIHYIDAQDSIRNLEKVNYPTLLEKSIMESIKLVSRDSLQRELDHYFYGINERNIELTSFKNIIIEMLIIIKKELYSVNIDLSDIFIDDYEEIYSILRMRSISEIRIAVMSFLDKIMNFMERTSNKSGNQIVQEVLNYIDKCYMSSDISVAEIAEKICLTPNYISSIVKKVTGENFSDIVLKKRIERAKELLFDVTLKTYEIAEMVGYTNPNYFSNTFRKIVGLTPAEFRNQFCS